MVDFFLNDPALEKRVPKYALYIELFKDIEDHSLIVSRTSHGYSKNVEEQIDPSIPKDSFRYLYSVNEESILVVSNIFVTLMPVDGEDATFDMFSNPDIVRIGQFSASTIGRDYPKNADGSPDEDSMDIFYCIEIVLNSMPTDGMAFLAEVVGDDGETVISDGDVVKVIEYSS